MKKMFTLFAILAITPTLTVAQDVTQVTADELASSWSSNELRANMTYGNKPLHITGIIDDISSTFGDYYVALKAGDTFLGIYVYVQNSALNDVAALSSGEKVTMYCENFEDNLGFECYNGYPVK